MMAKRNKLALALCALAAMATLGGWARRASADEVKPNRNPNLKRTVASEQDAAPGQLTIIRNNAPMGLCPLQHTDVKADISGFVARVTVEQEYVNPTNSPVEAIYTFPLPNDAAVDDMTMTIGARVIKGVIKEKEEAKKAYENAKANGQAAALLDQERPNIFTQSIANIMPGDTVKITISYVNLLKYEEGNYEFTFPMVVGPRYIPDPLDKTSTATVNDASKISPPVMPKGARAGHNISMTVNVDAGMPITQVKSVLHDVIVSHRNENRATVTLKKQNEIPNKDFILKYSASGSEVQAGALTYARTDKDGYFTLIVQPPQAPMQGQITPKEMIFVIDQSGSQSGFPIEKAKETMRYCLQNLNPGDTFELVGFSNEPTPLFKRAVPNTPANVKTALEYVDKLQGDGGTEFLKALMYALNLPDDPQRLRIVTFMTDGLIGSDFQVLNELKEKRGDARFFPFGTGNSVNRFLLDGMAREGKGQVEYVTLETSGKDVAEKFYRRIAKPLLTDIEIDWNGLPVTDTYPSEIPDIFTAQPLIIKGRYTGAASGDIMIKGKLRGQPWSRTLHLDLPSQDKDGSAIATVWAREKLDELMRQDYMSLQNGGTNPNLKQQIIQTAIDYRLMSQYTSFVAVENKVVNSGGRQQTIQVPVELPDGMADPRERMDLDDEALYSQSNIGGGFGGAVASKRAGGTNYGYAAPALPAAVPADSSASPVSPAQPKSKAEHKPVANLSSKLDDSLQAVQREASQKKNNLAEAQKPKTGTVRITITLSDLKPETLKKLKALGFKQTAKSTKTKQVTGWLPTHLLSALEKLTEVKSVKAVKAAKPASAKK